MVLRRSITVSEREVIISDSIIGSTGVAWRAERPSARHVSSAGSFAGEELNGVVSANQAIPFEHEAVRRIDLDSSCT